jgi:hypothetical protein
MSSIQDDDAAGRKRRIEREKLVAQTEADEDARSPIFAERSQTVQEKTDTSNPAKLELVSPAKPPAVVEFDGLSSHLVSTHICARLTLLAI